MGSSQSSEDGKNNRNEDVAATVASYATKATTMADAAKALKIELLNNINVSTASATTIVRAFAIYLEFVETNDKEKDDLEKVVKEKVLHCQHALNTLKRTEEDLSQERLLRKSLEHDLAQTKTANKQQNSKIEDLEKIERDLKYTQSMLTEEIKSSSQVEDLKLQLSAEIKSKEKQVRQLELEKAESELMSFRISAENDLLKTQLEKLTKTMKELQNDFDETKLKLEAETKTKQELEASLKSQLEALRELRANLNKTKANLFKETKTGGPSQTKLEEDDEHFKQLEKQYLVTEFQRLTNDKKVMEQAERVAELGKNLEKARKDLLAETRLRKTTEGKLFFIENQFRSLKWFCKNELGERKDFLKKVETSAPSGEVEVKTEGDSQGKFDELLKEKTVLEGELDGKINEIARLRQQLKHREDETQRLASREHVESKRTEMIKLHEEFMDTLKEFDAQ